LRNLEALTPAQLTNIRWRRMLQMRAYYALQVHWLLTENLVVARTWSASLRHRLAGHVDVYLDSLQALLSQLARQPDTFTIDPLAGIDANYDTQVRTQFLAHDAWVGHRWLIAPRRAGGHINVFETSPGSGRAAKIRLLETVAFLVDELTERMVASKTVEARAEVLTQLQRLSAIGAAGGSGSAARTKSAMRQLRRELARRHLLEVWSLPMAGFDPVKNQYRELVFSYQ
jgi:hypothetical protein